MEKRLDKKAIFNYKICDITEWTTDNNNTHITQYLNKKGNQTMKFGQLINHSMIKIFLKKPWRK